jgi:predicted nucleic acid-binding protein
MMSNTIALDTNVLIYLHDISNPAKRAIAKNLLADNPFIPSQVVSEYLNTTRRILSLSKDELLVQTSGLFSGCTIIPVLPDTLLFAAVLVKISVSVIRCRYCSRIH